MIPAKCLIIGFVVEIFVWHGKCSHPQNCTCEVIVSIGTNDRKCSWASVYFLRISLAIVVCRSFSSSSSVAGRRSSSLVTLVVVSGAIVCFHAWKNLLFPIGYTENTLKELMTGLPALLNIRFVRECVERVRKQHCMADSNTCIMQTIIYVTNVTMTIIIRCYNTTYYFYYYYAALIMKLIKC